MSNNETLKNSLVYPPPPSKSSGSPKLLTNFTHSAWPFMLRLNGPILSPASESDPHWRTIALGRYHSIVRWMTGLKMDA